MNYFIVSPNGFWSNENGWVYDLTLAKIFKQKDKSKVPLPEGKSVFWCCLPVKLDESK
ncbi:hypothetical protein [Viridibacillus arvi]|uniref:hypothetical protein n=1 Tax=Viridibacillus arvi TaxID=263475 RepID=UPI0034CFAB41